MSFIFGYWTIGMVIVYLFFLFFQKKYRLLLPSILHSFVWGITAVVMLFQMSGFEVSKKTSENSFLYSSEYMCYIVFSSIIGFTLAHIFIQNRHNRSIILIRPDIIDEILYAYRWIPYCCAITGLILFFFLFSVAGNLHTFNDYRIIALSTERLGYMAVVQRLSGHIMILGSFYLMFLGYKMGQTGIKIKDLFINIFMCSMINMSIGGRVWILNSTLPFFVSYFYSRHIGTHRKFGHDRIKIFVILSILISSFAVIGILRDDSNDEHKLIDKFLYFTDGTRITNMVLKQYPPGSYDLEYGKSEFLSSWVESPMAKRFDKSISHDVGLSVTVKSTLPFLYYDFGFWGGIIMWGIFCFLIEYLCFQSMYLNSFIGILLFGQLSQMLFQAPIFPIISLNIPYFEWILILYVFRRRIFNKITDYNQYI